jgi:hypothetical protein
MGKKKTVSFPEKTPETASIPQIEGYQDMAQGANAGSFCTFVRYCITNLPRTGEVTQVAMIQ